MTYATFSKGVKGGGFQQRVIVPRILQPTFGPEKLTAYELGATTDFFDRRLRVNVAAFQSNYNDLQVTTFPGGASRSEEHQSELQSLMRNSYAVFCLKNTNTKQSPEKAYRK